MLTRREKKAGPARRFADEIGPIETVLGATASVVGPLRSDAHVEVRGTIEGSCTVKGLLWIRPGAKVRGDVEVEQLILEGELEGKLSASGKVELRGGCRMQGTIIASSLAIAEDSFFEGRVEMQRDGSERSGAMTFREKRGRPESEA